MEVTSPNITDCGSEISVYSDFLIQSVLSLIEGYHLVPFLEKVGFVFNCGFCRTLVYKHFVKIDENGDSAGSDSSGKPGKIHSLNVMYVETVINHLLIKKLEYANAN